MKSYRLNKEAVFSEANIKECFIRAAKGKRNRSDVKKILNNLDYHVKILKEQLCDGTWEPSRHEPCQISDGASKKTRVIIKPTYKYEQVVHHVIVSALKEPFMRGMYRHSYGSVPGRGAHGAKDTVKRWIKDSKNVKYILKTDIRHFFNNVDHDILKSKLRKMFRDSWFLELVFKVIDCTDKGIPLGFYTSQWFANFILQDADHFIKEKLGARYYIRYMDDMVIFGRNKKELHRMRKEIDNFLREKLKLHLKGNWQVYRFQYRKYGKHRGRPLDFMGFVFYSDCVIIRKRIFVRAFRAIRKYARHGNIRNARVLLSYIGWFRHTDTHRVYQEKIKPVITLRQARKQISSYERRKRNAELQGSRRKPERKAA